MWHLRPSPPANGSLINMTHVGSPSFWDSLSVATVSGSQGSTRLKPWSPFAERFLDCDWERESFVDPTRFNWTPTRCQVLSAEGRAANETDKTYSRGACDLAAWDRHKTTTVINDTYMKGNQTIRKAVKGHAFLLGWLCWMGVAQELRGMRLLRAASEHVNSGGQQGAQAWCKSRWESLAGKGTKTWSGC